MEILRKLHDWGIDANYMAANKAAQQGNLEVLTTIGGPLESLESL